MAATWITPAGSLGIIPELTSYSLQLETYSSGNVAYTLITGALPGGLSMASNGNIRGNTIATNGTITSNFTVRATENNVSVADRGFSLTVASIVPPTLQPNAGSIGTFIDGSYVYQEFTITDPSHAPNTVFINDSGTIPANLSLANTGIMNGYLIPLTADAAYTFSIQANDGAKLDQHTYTANVYARKLLTADSIRITADNHTAITADTTPLYTPILLTANGSIGTVSQQTNFAYQIEAVDYDDEALTYVLVSGALPNGLTLNANTGWITGYIPIGEQTTITSHFSIRAYKTTNSIYTTETHDYSMAVLGQVDQTISWNTLANIGTIYNGSVSNLFVSASTPDSRPLTYELVGNGIGGLPPGLKLLPDGTIGGRVTFNINSSSQIYYFTITARDSNNFVYAEREFNVTVIKRDNRPYENLYIQLLPSQSQREIYNDLINDTYVFPPEYIYRYQDPWYSKNLQRRVLFLTGLNPDTASDYINSMTLNHYWKTLRFGSVKTAKAVDDSFNTIYEVVYVEIIDQQVDSDGIGPNLSVSWPENTVGISTVYPNSFPNMIERIGNGIGYQDLSILPRWMTSRQDDGTVLGFTRALVLCYTVPGLSDEIAYRVNEAYGDLNLVDFTIDRYEWDSILSDNFNTGSNTFVSSYTLGTGSITANTASNVVIGTAANISATGTITGTANSAVITGNSTQFYSELAVGSTVYVSGNSIGTIYSIISETSMKLIFPLVANVTGASFTVSGQPTRFTTELHVGDTLINAANTVIGNVSSIVSDTRLILAANSTANISANTYSYTTRDPYTTPMEGDKYLKFPQSGVLF